ncbi:M48 family metalloprotease [Parasynechococcus marenigrum]|uniref:Peptidase M48 domain-containing protein n=1 Tax=Parasynechococcus marenigrum (strain WH8102) TaxID=84588 RepID=Q7U5N8_PARMW|nr:M48 family metalloprotease [Parasynechococcus marenigrum]CAE08178.1 hypothetical [Parasynechococcus marenigrum WH 8102]
MKSNEFKTFSVTVISFFLGPLLLCAQPATATDRYSEQKEEMTEYIYPLYRMLERIMQTNKFKQGMSITSRAMGGGTCDSVECKLAEDLPKVSKDDNLLIWALQTINDTLGGNNATANSRNNLITVSRALQNNLAANTEGLACVVAHEAAHIERNHIKEEEKKRVSLDKIAAQKIRSAVANAHKAKKSNEFWAAVAVGMNAYNVGYASSQGNYAAAVQSRMNTENLARQLEADLYAGASYVQGYSQVVSQNLSRLMLSAPQTLNAMSYMEGLPASLVKRTMRDIEEYISDFALEMKKVSREHELDADKFAVTYMANAGLDPEKCIDVIDFLHRITGDTSTQPMATHPGETERKMSLRQVIDDLPPRLKRKYKNAGPRFKYPLLPYIYDKETEVVRLSLPGTASMQQGSNQRNSIVDSVLGN